MRVFLALLLVLVACESKRTDLAEETVTEVGEGNVAATSADGRFVVSYLVGALTPGSVVYIRTRRDLEANGLASLAYEVTVDPPQSAVEPGRASYRLQGEDPTDLRMVRFAASDPARVRVLADSRADAERVTATFYALPGTFAVNRRQRVTCAEFECGPRCALCEEGGACIENGGYTASDGQCLADPALCCVDDGLVGVWDAAPATGLTYVMDRLQLTRDVGFDLDAMCTPDGCVDNVLGVLAGDPPAIPIGAESHVLVELVGIPEIYTGDAESTVVKVYRGLRADPEESCCEFRVARDSLAGIPPQARARAPGSLARGLYRSLAPVPLDVRSLDDAATLRLDRAVLSMRVPQDLATLDAGLLGAYVAASTLAALPSVTGDATLLDEVTALGVAPDGDLDFDGLECLQDRDGDGRVDLCCDGVAAGPACDANGCVGEAIAPVDAGDPSSCVRAAQLADGFSGGFTFTAVAATIVGAGD